jgi:hypothetical protein
MENEDYRIIVKSNTTIKCFRDGRIFTFCNVTNQHSKKGEWFERSNKPNFHGYIQIKIGGKMYYAHRLIIEAFVGESEQEVDHIDRNKLNNNFQNLRYCTSSENSLNRDYCDNAKGYCWHKRVKKWQARISIDGKDKYLGCFDNEHDARQAFLQAKALRNMN